MVETASVFTEPSIELIVRDALALPFGGLISGTKSFRQARKSISPDIEILNRKRLDGLTKGPTS